MLFVIVINLFFHRGYAQLLPLRGCKHHANGDEQQDYVDALGHLFLHAVLEETYKNLRSEQAFIVTSIGLLMSFYQSTFC